MSSFDSNKYSYLSEDLKLDRWSVTGSGGNTIAAPVRTAVGDTGYVYFGDPRYRYIGIQQMRILEEQMRISGLPEGRRLMTVAASNTNNSDNRIVVECIVVNSRREIVVNSPPQREIIVSSSLPVIGGFIVDIYGGDILHAYIGYTGQYALTHYFHQANEKYMLHTFSKRTDTWSGRMDVVTGKSAIPAWRGDNFEAGNQDWSGDNGILSYFGSPSRYASIDSPSSFIYERGVKIEANGTVLGCAKCKIDNKKYYITANAVVGTTGHVIFKIVLHDGIDLHMDIPANETENAIAPARTSSALVPVFFSASGLKCISVYDGIEVVCEIKIPAPSGNPLEVDLSQIRYTATHTDTKSIVVTADPIDARNNSVESSATMAADYIKEVVVRRTNSGSYTRSVSGFSDTRTLTLSSVSPAVTLSSIDSYSDTGAFVPNGETHNGFSSDGVLGGYEVWGDGLAPYNFVTVWSTITHDGVVNSSVTSSGNEFIILYEDLRNKVCVYYERDHDNGTDTFSRAATKTVYTFYDCYTQHFSYNNMEPSPLPALPTPDIAYYIGENNEDLLSSTTGERSTTFSKTGVVGASQKFSYTKNITGDESVTGGFRVESHQGVASGFAYTPIWLGVSAATHKVYGTIMSVIEDINNPHIFVPKGFDYVNTQGINEDYKVPLVTKTVEDNDTTWADIPNLQFKNITVF